jgi:predicted dehydrogenase
MNNKIRIGVIGCGQTAQSHLTIYGEVPEAEIVAVCSRTRASAEATAARFKVPHICADFRELIARDDIDAVDVCLHTNLHRPVAEAALRAGKHVYCEKPMAGSYRDALAMMETAKASGRKLHIQLATLYANETRAARELITAGELGDLYHARSSGFRRRGRPYVDGYGTPAFVRRAQAGGGALYDMGVYHIAQVLYLLGNPAIERISGKVYQKIAMDEGRRAASGYDVEELGLGLVRFAGDLTMDLIESWALNLDQLEGSWIAGTRGGVRLAPFGFHRSIGEVDLSAGADLGNARFRWEHVQGDGLIMGSPQHHWIAALQGRVALMPTAEIALATMLVSEGVYLSDRLRREVTAEEVVAASVSTATTV